MDLLDRIRRSPLTAISPEAGIDLERVGFHAAQAVALGTIATAIALVLMLIHANDLGYFQYLGLAGGFLSYIVDQVTNLTGADRYFSWDFRAPGLSLGVVLMAGVLAFESIVLLWYMQTRNFKRDNYNPQFKLPLPEGLVNFFRARGGPNDPEQNVVVFGGFQPFVGSGEALRDWQFVMDLSRTKTDHNHDDLPSISLTEIYNCVDEAIQKRGLPFLKQQERVYANGDELIGNQHILPTTTTRPISRLDWSIVHQKAEKTPVAAEDRVYRVYSYEDTRHDTTTSAFLHLARYGNNLYVESAFRVLLPINEDIYNIDKRMEMGLVRRVLWGTGLTLVYLVLPTVRMVALGMRLFTLGRYLLKWYQEDRKQRQVASRNVHVFNYGVVRTFRETVAYRHFASYFAMKDTVAYVQALEECFLFAVSDALEAAGVDVSSLRQTATNYFVNNGIYQTGGTMTASQVSAGQGASNIFNPAAASGGTLLQQAGGALSQGISRATGSK